MKEIYGSDTEGGRIEREVSNGREYPHATLSISNGADPVFIATSNDIYGLIDPREVRFPSPFLVTGAQMKEHETMADSKSAPVQPVRVGFAVMREK